MSGETHITTFAAKLVNQTSIKLTWTGNYNTVSIYQSTNKDKTYTELAEYTHSSSYTITTLIPNTVYFFYIIPYNIYGDEGEKKDTFITTPYNIVITSLYAGSPGITSIPLYWSGIYYSIRIKYKRFDQSDYYIKDIYPIIGTSSYIVTGLDVDTSYNFQLIPYDLNDFSGAATNIIYAKTDYLSYIGNIYLGTVTSGTTIVSWDGRYSYVNLQHSFNNTTFDTNASINITNDGTYTFRRLEPLTTYYFRVVSYDDYHNIGKISKTVSCTTLSGFKTTSIKSVSTDSAVLTWDGSYSIVEVYKSTDGGITYSLLDTITYNSRETDPNLQLFELNNEIPNMSFLTLDDDSVPNINKNYTLDSDFVSNENTRSTNTVNYTVSNLTKNTNYKFYLLPYYNGVVGTSSEVFDVKTDFNPDMSFSISPPTTNNILPLKFTAEGLTYPYYTYCKIEISMDNTAFYDVSTIYQVPSIGNPYIYTITDYSGIDHVNLIDNYTYYVRVTPYSSYGNPGKNVIVKSHSTLGSIDITTFTVTLNNNIINLNWSGYFKSTYVEYSTDNFISGTNITSLLIYRNDSYPSNTTGLISSSYTASSLSSMQTYYFRLKPVNYNGDIGSTTISCYNATITDISLSNITSSSVILNWAGTYSTVTIQSSSDGTTFTEMSDLIRINSSSISIITSGSTVTYYRIIPFSPSGFYGRTSSSVYTPVVSSSTLSVIDALNISITWLGTMDYANILYSIDNITYYTVSTKVYSPANISFTGMNATNTTYFFKVIPYSHGYPTTTANYDVSGLPSTIVYNATITTAYFTALTGGSIYNSIFINWKGTYAGLYIYYDVNSNFSSNTYIRIAGANSGVSLRNTTISNLLSNTTYYFKLIPYNSNGNNGLNYPIISATTNSLLTGFNFAYNASNSTTTSVQLTWSNNNYYLIRIYNLDGTSYGDYYNNTNITYINITGLSANKIYTFYAIVYDENGNSERTTNVVAYTSATTENLNLKYQTSITSGYTINPKKIIFSWDNSGYYSISIKNTTTASSITKYFSTGGTTFYDSFLAGEGNLIQNTYYTYLFTLNNAYGSEISFTRQFNTLGTITAFDISKNTFTSSQIPIQFTGIFNNVIVDVSDGNIRGNTYIYGIGSSSNTVTISYNLTSSNSIISQANKMYWITLYPINDGNYVGLASSTYYAKTLGAITTFYSPRVIDNSGIALYWDGSFASITIESSTNSSFTSDYVSTRISSSYPAGGAGISGYVYNVLQPNKQYFFRVTPINQPLSDGNDVSGVTIYNNTYGTTLGKLNTLYTYSYYDTSATVAFDGSFASLDISTNGVTTQYTSQRNTGTDISNLIPGSTYSVTTIIRNSAGYTVAGNTITFTTRSKIIDFSATPIDSSSIYVGWKAIGSLSSVKLIWNTIGGTYSTTDSSNSFTSSPAYITGLSFADKRYYFQITPTSSVGNGYIVNDVSNVTYGKLTSLYTYAYYDTSATVAFDGSFTSVDISTNGVMKRYTSQRNTGTDISNLIPGSTYSVTTIIRNSAGYTVAGNTITFTTRSKITGFSATALDSSSISVSWTATGSLSSVKLIWNNIGGTYSTTDSSNSFTSSPAYITGLSLANKRYYFQITPTSSVGDGYIVNDASTVTWGKLNSFLVDTSNITSTAIPLKWDGSFNRLRIQQSLDGTTYTDASNIISYDSSGVTLTNLYSNKQYYIRAIPINDAIIDGTVTRTITGTTLAYIGNVYATNITSSSFVVNVDLSAGSTYSSYYVFNTTAGGTKSAFVTYPNNSITLSSLNPNTTYNVVIYAYNYNTIDGSGTVVTYNFSGTTTLATITGASTANPFTDLSSGYYSITLYGSYTSFKLQYIINNITYNTSYASYGSKITVSDLSANTTYAYTAFANNKTNGTGTDVSRNFTVTTLGATPSFNPKTPPNYSQTNSITFDIYRGEYSAVRIKTSTTVDMSSGVIYTVDISNDTILTLGNVYIQRDLSVNTLYYFNSTPINALGQLGNPSTTVPLSTLGNLTAFSLGSTSDISSTTIPVSWTGAYNTIRLEYAKTSDNYALYDTYSNDTIPTWRIITINKTVTGLLPNTSYKFRATPISIDNLSGTTLILTDISAMTLATITTNTITNTIYDISSVITFDGSFSRVRVYSSPTSLDKSYIWQLGGIRTGTDISGLNANTAYTFYYVPYNSNGVSNPVTGTPLYSSTFYTQPRISSYGITIPSSTSISINWVWSGSTTLATTRVSTSTDNSTYSYYSTVASAGTSVAISSLSPNNRYYVALTPKAQSDTSGYTVYISDTNLVTMGDVTTVNEYDITSSSIKFTVNGNFKSIKLVNTTKSNDTKTYTGTPNSYTINNISESAPNTGLTANTQYTFRFYAINSVDYESNAPFERSYYTEASISTATVTPTSSTALSLSRTLSGRDTNVSVTIYTSTNKIDYYSYGVTGTGTTSNNNTIDKHNNTNLLANTQYYIRLVPKGDSNTDGDNYDISGYTYGAISGTPTATEISTTSAKITVEGTFAKVRITCSNINFDRTYTP